MDSIFDTVIRTHKDIDNYSTDPAYTHEVMEITITALGACLAKHMNLWLELSENRSDEMSKHIHQRMDAGVIYNNMQLGRYRELTNDEMLTVCQTFKASINVLKSPIASMEDDLINCMWTHCHYFIIPLRLRSNSIPMEEKRIYLQRWISVCFTLPFVNMYITKLRADKGLEKYMEPFCQTLSMLRNPSSKDDIIPKFMSTNIAMIKMILDTRRSASNLSAKFMRSFAGILLMASGEIIRRFCPFIKEAIVLNPSFDGCWLEPNDSLHHSHISHLNKFLSRYFK